MLFELLAILSFMFSFFDKSQYWYMWLIGCVFFLICALIKEHFD